LGADNLLGRLAGVKSIGHGKYKARCPAHEDRSPSLSVRVLDDGRILLHCFAGCGAADVVESLGLTLDALFPDKEQGHARPTRRPYAAADLLHFVDRESLVVLVLACDAIAKQRLAEADLARVMTARARISSVIACLPA